MFSLHIIILIGLVSYSLSFGWIESPLFRYPRKVVSEVISEELSRCYHCVGFYAGIISGFLILDNYSLSKIIVSAFIGSSLSLIINSILLYLEEVTRSINSK